MKFRVRGVKDSFDGTEWVEIVCLCRCHVSPMMHFRPCCHTPRTEAGTKLLAEFTNVKTES